MEVVIYCARKKRLFFLGLFLFFIMSVSGIYSLNREINVTETGISTGAVDIEIKEYNNTQPFDEDGKPVMPGDEIVLIPRVNNLGVDCYLRAKIEYVIDGNEFPVIDYIDGTYSSWTKKGDYYYYDSVFSKKSHIDLFNKVTIPNLSSEYYGKTVVVHIIVEAVQARNFNGNWDSVDIRKSIDRAYDVDYEGESTIIYEDNTDQHITFDDSFFNKLGNMLPGDSVSEKIVLLNKSSSNNEYYLSINYDSLTEEELALLRKIRIIIKKQDGEVLADSNLGNKNTYDLGIYRIGEGETFTIEVSIPSDVNNDFSKIYTKIKWDFSYSIYGSDDIINPITYDSGIDIYMIVFIFSTIGLIINMFLWKKENQKDKKNI